MSLNPARRAPMTESPPPLTTWKRRTRGGSPGFAGGAEEAESEDFDFEAEAGVTGKAKVAPAYPHLPQTRMAAAAMAGILSHEGAISKSASRRPNVASPRWPGTQGEGGKPVRGARRTDFSMFSNI